MDLQFVEDGSFSYYTVGMNKVTGDTYSLLGFKNNMPVLNPDHDAPKMKSQIKILRKLPSSINLSNLLVDETGDKFINLNGQKLKVVPQDQIPEEVRKRTLLLKQQMVNIGATLKKQLPIRVIRNTTHLNNADTIQLVELSADKLITTHKDKAMNIHGLKKIKLIRTKLQKPTFSGEAIHTEISVQSTCSVNPIIPPLWIHNQPTTCGEQSNSASDPDSGLQPVANRREKLLSVKNIRMLNKVKMQALNLSLKQNIKTAFEQKCKTTATLVEIGIQTDEWDTKKAFTDQMIQTDHELISDLFNVDLDFLLNMPMESPHLIDGNLSSSSSVGKSLTTLTADGTGKIINMGVSAKPVNEQTMKQQVMFFRDLRECLTHNASGNLPIHEGVINNDVGLVKRHCIALKARKAGVNLENHNGCTPLQLAIINDSHVDIVQTLLDTGAELTEQDGEGNNILHLGAKFERHRVLEVILYHKSLSYCFDCINGFNFEGLTPLMICCMASWTIGAQLFINHGANVNLKDQTSGRTALFHAAEVQNIDIVRILLNHKADPKIKNFFGTSPHDAMYELDEMSETIKSLIFGKSKKRTIEAEMNPTRTAKAAKNLKTFSRLQKIENKDGVPIIAPPLRYKMQRQIK